jgi:hypothetical protein
VLVVKVAAKRSKTWKPGVRIGGSRRQLQFPVTDGAVYDVARKRASGSDKSIGSGHVLPAGAWDWLKASYGGINVLPSLPNSMDALDESGPFFEAG